MSVRGRRQKIDYGTYMASRDWRLQRKEAFRITGGLCNRCGALATQGHHLTYERLGHEDRFDVMPVCRRCHLFLSAESDFDPAPVAILAAVKDIEATWVEIFDSKGDTFFPAAKFQVQLDGYVADLYWALIPTRSCTSLTAWQKTQWGRLCPFVRDGLGYELWGWNKAA